MPQSIATTTQPGLQKFEMATKSIGTAENRLWDKYSLFLICFKIRSLTSSNVAQNTRSSSHVREGLGTGLYLDMALWLPASDYITHYNLEVLIVEIEVEVTWLYYLEIQLPVAEVIQNSYMQKPIYWDQMLPCKSVLFSFGYVPIMRPLWKVIIIKCSPISLMTPTFWRCPWKPVCTD